VTPDIRGKLPGRGVWVSADKDTLGTAVKTGAFARGFKAQCEKPDGLLDQVEGLLSQHLLGQVSMALKSGNLVMGFDQVRKLTRENPVAVRLEALDGSEGGRSKIRTLSKAVSRECEVAEPPAIGCFMAVELGQAIGRDAIVHAVVKPGKLARSMVETAHKLSGFRPIIPNEWPDRSHENTILFPPCGNPESTL
jgi:ribosomal protein L30E